MALAGGLIVKWESGGSVPLTAYKDPVGVWTICHGHTRGVYPGMTVMPEQCETWLAEDMAYAAEAVDLCIHYPIGPRTTGALVSAVFNLGPSVVCGSTLQRKMNAGDVYGGCRELTHARNSDGGNRGWSFAEGRFFPGLYARRVDEFHLCWPDFWTVRGGAETWYAQAS